MIRPGDAFMVPTTAGGYAFGCVLGVDGKRGTALVLMQAGGQFAVPQHSIESGTALLRTMATEVRA